MPKQSPASDPATDLEKREAATAAAALRAALADPAAAGERIVAHKLLPGWEYTAAEMRTELIEDLDRLASDGERPKNATARHKATPAARKTSIARPTSSP